MLSLVKLASLKITCAAKPRQGARLWRNEHLQRDTATRKLYNGALMESGLRNRVAIVAASSQGSGGATAEPFAAEGCRLAMCARNRDALNAVAEKIRSQHKTEVLAEPFDVTDTGAVRDFVNAVVQKFGSADICVTNAGGPPAKGFLATTIDEWKRAVEVNFMSTVYFAHQVIPHMQKKKWGRIITITSITTKQPVADLVYSNAVRAAVVGLVKSLANEFGKDGILVNNVGPGFTATDRLKELAHVRSAALGKTETEIFEGWAADTALKRLGEPREVADTMSGWPASELPISRARPSLSTAVCIKGCSIVHLH